MDYVVSDKSELAEALNDELGELRVAIELLEAKIEGLDAAVAHWRALDADMQLVTDHVELIRDAWARGDTESLKPLLRTLIQSVNINADGDGHRVELKLFALPQMAANRLVEEVAPKADIRIPGDSQWTIAPHSPFNRVSHTWLLHSSPLIPHCSAPL